MHQAMNSVQHGKSMPFEAKLLYGSARPAVLCSHPMFDSSMIFGVGLILSMIVDWLNQVFHIGWISIFMAPDRN